MELSKKEKLLEDVNSHELKILSHVFLGKALDVPVACSLRSPLFSTLVIIFTMEIMETRLS